MDPLKYTQKKTEKSRTVKSPVFSSGDGFYFHWLIEWHISRLQPVGRKIMCALSRTHSKTPCVPPHFLSIGASLQEIALESCVSSTGFLSL